MLDLKKLMAKLLDKVRTVEFNTFSGSLADKSIASTSAWINVGTINIPKAGVWRIRATLMFPNNSTGRRLATISRTSAAFGTALSTATMQAVNGYQTYMQVEMTENFSANTTVYINAAHNAGSALTVSTRYYLEKLGDKYSTVS